MVRTFTQDKDDEDRATQVLFVHGGHAIVGGSTAGRVNVWFVGSGRKLPTLTIPSK